MILSISKGGMNVTDWQPVQGVLRLLPNACWVWLWSLVTLRTLSDVWTCGLKQFLST